MTKVAIPEAGFDSFRKKIGSAKKVRRTLTLRLTPRSPPKEENEDDHPPMFFFAGSGDAGVLLPL